MTVAAKKRAMTVSVIYDADDDMIMMIGLVDHCDIVSDSVLIGAAQRHGVDEFSTIVNARVKEVLDKFQKITKDMVHKSHQLMSA